MKVAIRYTTRIRPQLPYARYASDILGEKYELSLVFIGDKRSRALNKTYRNKSYTPNVLAFPLLKNKGEIFINPRQAMREAHRYHMTPKNFIGFLFIHALLHLKGLDHGDTMEKAENRYAQRYGFL